MTDKTGTSFLQDYPGFSSWEHAFGRARGTAPWQPGVGRMVPAPGFPGCLYCKETLQEVPMGTEVSVQRLSPKAAATHHQPQTNLGRS